jgi:membrane protease YdiL (CAAX protease family)
MQQLMAMFVFYVLQTLFAVTAIKLFVTKRLSDAGFSTINHSESIRILMRFMFVWTVVVVVFYTLSLIFVPPFEDYLKGFCPPDVLYGVKNVVGGSVLAGLGEEPLFRGFVVLMLAKQWDGGFRIGKRTISYVSLLSGFIFMTAHIGYVFVPHFEIVRIDPLQLTYTFILGVFWSAVFERTKSLLAPVAAHIWANFIQYALGYAVVFLLL